MYTVGREATLLVHPWVGRLHSWYTRGYEGCASRVPVGMRDVPLVYPWVW